MNKLLFVCALFYTIHSFGIYGELNTENQVSLQKGVVSLYAPNEDGELKVFCSATIINRYQLLTAAHCFDVIQDEIKVLYKDFYYPAQKLLINKNYHREDIYDEDWGYLLEVKLTGDFALVELAPIFAPTDFVTIAEDSIELSVGDEVSFSGFGQVARIFGVGHGEGTLRTSVAVAIDEVSANGRMKVNEGRSGLCLGDSGGATFYTKETGEILQVGVNSLADCMVVSVFESIDMHKILNGDYNEILLKP